MSCRVTTSFLHCVRSFISRIDGFLSFPRLASTSSTPAHTLVLSRPLTLDTPVLLLSLLKADPLSGHSERFKNCASATSSPLCDDPAICLPSALEDSLAFGSSKKEPGAVSLNNCSDAVTLRPIPAFAGGLGGTTISIAEDDAHDDLRYVGLVAFGGDVSCVLSNEVLVAGTVRGPLLFL